MTLEIEKIKIDDVKENIEKLNEEFKSMSTQDILDWSFNTYGENIVLASSLGLEDQVLTDISVKLFPKARIFVLDTGRLHQKTYDVLEDSMEKYNNKYDILFPKFEDVQALEEEHGPNPFYKSLELRHRCCGIRKLEPLHRVLDCYDAWITGLRRDQSITRTGVKKIEWDEINNIVKLNPLLDWTDKEVENYIYENNVPYNKLFDEGFTSIGCAPCTRATKVGEHPRAGRWWWENPEKRECGLHEKY